MADQPWHELPPKVAAMLLPLLPELSAEIIEAVGTVPAYSRPIEGDFGVGVRAGVEQALAHLVKEIQAGGPVPRSDVYHRLGRGEMRAGRSLDALLSAYRLGARVAWRRVVAAGEAAGLEPATLYMLAEAIFAYIDVLSAESAEGYALEQTATAGQAELARRRLVRVLVREPAAESELVVLAARDAGWELPRTLAAVAITAPASGAVPVGLRLPLGCLADQIGDLTCAIVPDPDAPGRRAELERAVGAAGAHAALGTTVGWPDAARSFARARAALGLGLGTADEPLIAARDRSGELLLAGDPPLASEFAADRLAPLAALAPGARARMTATLAAWLAEQGRLGAVAQRLEIHPQTARYRLARMRELFGDRLDDPDERFWLELALRVSA
jgi:hypothetical protein